MRKSLQEESPPPCSDTDSAGHLDPLPLHHSWASRSVHRSRWTSRLKVSIGENSTGNLHDDGTHNVYTQRHLCNVHVSSGPVHEPSPMTRYSFVTRLPFAVLGFTPLVENLFVEMDHNTGPNARQLDLTSTGSSPVRVSSSDYVRYSIIHAYGAIDVLIM
jgi:hypothetical protein